MYTKEELEQLSIPELMEIANDMEVKVSQDDELETVIYAILDKAAEDSAAGVNSSKRKRTRIAKKDTNKVYTVNGTEGENLDAKGTKVKKPSLDSLLAEQEASEKAQEAATKEESAEATATAAVADKPAPKKRGRKSKKELAEIAAAEAARLAAAQQEGSLAFSDETATNDAAEVPEAVEPSAEIQAEAPTDAPSDVPATDTTDTVEAPETGLPANDDESSLPEGVWEGDPGDGTDFITIVDIPIEDQEALPTLDMFDRPVVQQEMETGFARNAEEAR